MGDKAPICIYVNSSKQICGLIHTYRYSCLPRERSNVDMVVQKEAPFYYPTRMSKASVQNWTGLLISFLSTQPAPDTPRIIMGTLTQKAIRYHYGEFKGTSRTALFLSKKQSRWRDGVERYTTTTSLAFSPYEQRSYTWLTPTIYAIYWI